MKSPRRAAGGSGDAGQPRLFREWIGGRLWPPFIIEGPGEPYRPSIVIWMEVPEGLVVGQAVVPPQDADGSVARTLRSAMTQPLVGTPRRPDVYRVADAATAAEVRAEVGDGAAVTVAPTPELDELLEQMVATMPSSPYDDASYLAEGHVSPAAVKKLFAASLALFAAKPWAVAADVQVVRVDIPALDVEGACASIIGGDEHQGLLLFPSAADFDRHLEDVATGALDDGSAGLGTEVLSLTFAPAAGLPPTMRREAMEHGWPVAGPDAYPRIQRLDPNGTRRALVERDVEVATACALALSAFFARHASIFESDTPAPVCESYFDDDDREVRVTAPYEALADFDLPEDPDPDVGAGRDPVPPAEPFRPRVGRNDPCPCGSGRKYTRCHLAADGEAHGASRSVTALHDLDRRLVVRLTRFALAEYGETWREFEDDFSDPEASSQLAWPWSVYGFEVGGRSVAETYREAPECRCSPAEHRWLDAQRAAWLSVWEVEAVEPGRGLTVHDLLSGERRTVQETQGSRTLVLRDALLGRVVEQDGVAVLCGTHPCPLPPFDAADVVRRARGHLRRRRAVPVERLRNASFGRYLIRRWEEAVEYRQAVNALPPDLRNHDGDPLVLTVDHFEIGPGHQATVDDAVGTIGGAQPEPSDPDTSSYVFLRADDPERHDGQGTVIGRAEVEATTLRLETNSVPRADALRERIETACGARIRHRGREHTDPLVRRHQTERRPPAPVSPDGERLVAEFKARHYAGWPDQPLPALNNRTPRECMRTAAGRQQVDLLLKGIEHTEQRGPGVPFDVSAIRRHLGLISR